MTPTRPSHPKVDRVYGGVGDARWQARPPCRCASDLDLALDTNRPDESTDALLSACLHDAHGASPSSDEVAQWTVADRLDGLLQIRIASGAEQQTVALQCADCGADFAADIHLPACLQNRPVAPVLQFESGGKPLQARLPTGAEQRRWRREGTPLYLVAAALVQGPHAGAPFAPEAGDVMLQALDDALSQHDPLRTLQLDLVCPDCGAERVHTVELDTLLLEAMVADQAKWLDETATIAAGLHWSETEIAAMPHWRRRHYLHFLARAGAVGPQR